MANQADIDRARTGKEVWNIWALSEIEAGRNPVADFSESTIDLRSFEEFVFPGQVDFSDSTFSGRTSFNGARFVGPVLFRGATFTKTTYFTGAKFEGSVSFGRARALRHFGFAQARVMGNASFQRCSFAAAVKFNETIFERAADFVDAHFSGSVRFLSVRFSAEAQFSNVTFSERVSFFQARFESNSLFNAAMFKGITTNLTGIHFARVPDFRTTKFEFPPNFHATSISYRVASSASWLRRLLRCAADSVDAARYRRLKQLAGEAKDHEKELEFFSSELRAKRFHETSSVGSIFLNVLYDWLSNYGRSIARPVSLLVLTVMLSMGAIAWGRQMTPQEAWAKRDALAMAAITNSGLLLGAEKSDLRAKALRALGSPCSSTMNFSPDILAYLQSAASLLALFLIGLALRNRFRVGGSG